MHAFSIVLLHFTGVDAYSSYKSRIPNGANIADGPGAGGHKSSGGGGSRHAFGNDFASAGRMWTTSLCEGNSDGDAFTNGVRFKIYASV